MIEQKARNLLVSVFGTGASARDRINFSVPCPECDSQKTKKKLSVRLDDFRYHCWVCGLRGKNIWKYISRKFPNVKIDSILFSSKNYTEKSSLEKEEDRKVILPSGLVPVFRESNDPDIRSVRSYLLKRGFSLGDIFRWRVMTSSKGKFRRRAIIPSFDCDGNLNYFVSRSIDEDGLKYLNAKIPKGEIVFNEIDIDWNKSVILVEGIFDAMKSIENSVPILGSTLSKKSNLYNKLMKNQSNVTVSLDPDLKHKAYKIADDLYEAGCNVRICFAPDGKDMGNFSKKENRQMILSSKIFTPYTSLSHKIKSIRSGSII